MSAVLHSSLNDIRQVAEAAHRLGTVRDQRLLLVEPVRTGYLVHLVHNPGELADRPGAVSPPPRVANDVQS